MVDYSVEVLPGQTVAITGGAAGEPLLRAIYRAVVARGAHPVLVPTFSGLAAELLGRGSDEQLGFVTPVERFMRAEADVVITVQAETNTKALSGVDPARSALFQRARAELMQTYLQRAADGRLRWVLTLYPTDAYAQDAEMSTAGYAEFVLRAAKLDEPDPIAAWRAVEAEQERLIDRLKVGREIKIVGPDTDLTLSVAGRTWINANGKRNFPDGEVFTGPVETSAKGRVRCSFPVVHAGREIEDIRLTFRDGVVVAASAARNEAYLLQQLETDDGARRLGEFAIGTNSGITRFTKNILFDEKIGGTVHLALGAGYPQTGSTNRSAIHWDVICDLRQGGEVTVDGEVLLRDGVLVGG